MTVHVFLGSTLSVIEGRRILDATWHPPAVEGDVETLLDDRPEAIAILDATTLAAAELASALEQGIRVFGGAHRGAGHAARLAEMGMVGVGRAFEALRQGTIAPADVEPGPDGPSRFDVAEACASAVDRGAVSAATAIALEAVAGEPAELRWTFLFDRAGRAGVPAVEIDRFRAFLDRHGTAARRDATDLLERLAGYARDGWPQHPGPAGADVRLADALRARPFVSGQTLEVVRKKVLLRILAGREAARLGCEPTPAEVQAVVDSFRMRHELGTAESIARWLEREGLEETSVLAFLRDLAAVGKVQTVLGPEIDRFLADHVRIDGVRTRTRGETWLQMNVGLVRVEGRALPSARALFARLAPALEAWRREGRVSRFFFMRKPPDLRLRFLGPRAPEVLLPLAEAVLADRSFATACFPSVYEPEFHLFGGPEAMEYVHAWHDADSMAWIEGPPEIDRCPWILDDLFVRTLGRGVETWDVWRRLADLAGDPREEIDVSPVEVPAPLAEANQRLAEGLRSVWSSGRLEAGLRSVLVFVAMFHLNRHGHPGPDQAAVARAMARRSDPHR